MIPLRNWWELSFVNCLLKAPRFFFYKPIILRGSIKLVSIQCPSSCASMATTSRIMSSVTKKESFRKEWRATDDNDNDYDANIGWWYQADGFCVSFSYQYTSLESHNKRHSSFNPIEFFNIHSYNAPCIA